jgi:hypothetical protein
VRGVRARDKRRRLQAQVRASATACPARHAVLVQAGRLAPARVQAANALLLVAAAPKRVTRMKPAGVTRPAPLMAAGAAQARERPLRGPGDVPARRAAQACKPQLGAAKRERER